MVGWGFRGSYPFD